MAVSQHHKLILVFFATAIGSAWTGYSLNSDNNKNQDYAGQTTNSSAAAVDHELIDQLQQKIQQLQNENNQLARQLHSQSVQTVVPSSNTQSPDQHQIDQQLNEKLQALEMEKHQRKAEDFGAWALKAQQENRSFNLDNELANRFHQESRDSVWADQQESYYQQLFSSEEALRDFALRDTQCRSTQCEVTISVNNAEQSQQLLQTMSRTLQGVVILLSSDEGSGTSKLYIGRDEKSFEFN